VRRQLPGYRAHVLGRRHHQHDVAAGDVGQRAGSAQAGIEGHARQERRVGMARVDLGHHVGL
jgi:hypothetical protein